MFIILEEKIQCRWRFIEMIIFDVIFAGILLAAGRDFFERKMNIAGWLALFCSAFQMSLVFLKVF